MVARMMCLLVLLLAIRGISMTLSDWKWKTLIFYTQLSNVMAAVSAALLLVFGQPMWITVLRYLSSCMLVMTFFVTICVLIPMGGDPKTLLWTGCCLYLHVLCPITSTLSYILVENHAGSSWIWLPVVLTLIYGVIMLVFNGLRKVDGPYPFFRVHNQSVLATVIWMCVLMGVITGFSTLVWLAA